MLNYLHLFDSFNVSTSSPRMLLFLKCLYSIINGINTLKCLFIDHKGEVIAHSVAPPDEDMR